MRLKCQNCGFHLFNMGYLTKAWCQQCQTAICFICGNLWDSKYHLSASCYLNKLGQVKKPCDRNTRGQMQTPQHPWIAYILQLQILSIVPFFIFFYYTFRAAVFNWSWCKEQLEPCLCIFYRYNIRIFTLWIYLVFGPIVVSIFLLMVALAIPVGLVLIIPGVFIYLYNSIYNEGCLFNMQTVQLDTFANEILNQSEAYNS